MDRDKVVNTLNDIWGYDTWKWDSDMDIVTYEPGLGVYHTEINNDFLLESILLGTIQRYFAQILDYKIDLYFTNKWNTRLKYKDISNKNWEHSGQVDEILILSWKDYKNHVDKSNSQRMAK